MTPQKLRVEFEEPPRLVVVEETPLAEEEEKKERVLFLPQIGPGLSVVPESKVPRLFRDMYFGLVRGLGNTVANLAALPSMTGVDAFESLRKTGLEAAQAAGPSPRVEDINSVMDFASWLAENSAEQLPNVLTVIGGAAAGSVASLPLAGAALSSFFLNAGETFNNLRERGVDVTKAGIASGLTGSAKTVLDMIVPVRVSGKLAFLPFSRVASNSRLLKALFSDVMTEGVEEAGQEVLDIGTEAVLGVNRPEENFSRILNAFAAGATTAKVYSAAGKILGGEPSEGKPAAEIKLEEPPAPPLTKVESIPDQTIVPESVPQVPVQPPTPAPAREVLNTDQIRTTFGLPPSAPIDPLVRAKMIVPIGPDQWEVRKDTAKSDSGDIIYRGQKHTIMIRPEHPEIVFVDGVEVDAAKFYEVVGKYDDVDEAADAIDNLVKEALGEESVSYIRSLRRERLKGVARGFNIETDFGLYTEKTKKLLEGIRAAIEIGSPISVDNATLSINGEGLSPTEFSALKRFIRYSAVYNDKPVVLQETGKSFDIHEDKPQFDLQFKSNVADIYFSRTVNEIGDGLVEVIVTSNGKFMTRGSLSFSANEYAGVAIPEVIKFDLKDSRLANYRTGELPALTLANLFNVVNGQLFPQLRERALDLHRQNFKIARETGIYDPDGVIPKIGENIRAELVEKLVGELKRTRSKLIRAYNVLLQNSKDVDPSYRSVTGRVKGIALYLRDAKGALLKNPDNDELVIAINPYATPARSAKQLASYLFSGLLHEISHGFVESDASIYYAYALTDAIEAYAPAYAAFEEAIVKEFGDEQGNLSSQYLGIGELLSTYIGEASKSRTGIVDISGPRGVDTVRRLIDRIRKTSDPAIVAELEERVKRKLAEDPGIVFELLKDEQVAEFLRRDVEKLPEEVMVYRANVPGRTNAIDLYRSKESAQGAKYYKFVHSDLANLVESLEKNKKAWLKIGRSFFLVEVDPEGEDIMTIKSGKDTIIARDKSEVILRRIKDEIEAIKKTIEEKRQEVTGYRISREYVLAALGDLIIAKPTPTMINDVIQNGIHPKLHLGTEPDAAKAIRAAAQAAQVLEKIKGWKEKEVELGLDSINRWFGKTARIMTILQMADRLKKFTPLQEYVDFVRKYWITKMTVLEEASVVLEDWIRMGNKNAQILGDVLREVSRKSFREKRLLSPQEVNVVIKAFGGDPEIIFPMWERIDGLFRKMGLEMYNAIQDNLNRMYPSEVAELMLERYEKIKALVISRNYFPFTRFGKWGVVVKSPKGEVVLFEAFKRQAQMRKRIAELKKEMPDHEVQSRYLDDSEVALLQFPPALVDYLSAQLELTTEQVNKLKEIQQALSPAGHFVKHFLKRSLTPGESRDAQAAFADYFQHLSNHLARLRYRYDLEKKILQMDEIARNVPRGAYVGEVVSVLKRHLFDLLNPSNELASLRAGVFLYMFALLPSAAVVNLMQVPTYTYPYLAKRVKSDAKAIAAIVKAGAKILKAVKEGPDALTKFERDMLERGTREGFIEESYLATIGQTASRGYLASFWEGAPALGYYFTRLAKLATALFHGAEVYNRKVTFLAALDIAKQLGYEGEETIFKFAREAVEKTQFEYAYYNRPQIFRGGAGIAQLKPMIGLFKMFLQHHLYFAFTNQGGWRLWMMLLALAGIKGGVPFSEEALNILDLLGTFIKKKLGLPNPKVDLEVEARKFIAAVGANPDLVIHGLSRYGFGLAPMAHLFGLPFPAADFSNMISMQEILPFVRPFKQALLGEVDPKNAVQEAFFRTMGAVFTTGVGTGASLLETLRGDPLGLRATRLWPRAFQSILKSWRALQAGAWLDNSGDVIAKIDPRDPTHVAELIAQALGAPPTRVTQRIQADVVAREHIAFYEAWKESIARMYADAVVSKDAQLKEEATKELRRYNKVAPLPMRWRIEDFKDSVRTRVRNRNKSLLGYPPQKRYSHFFREMQSLYSGQQPATQ